MTIRFKCDECDSVLKIKDELAGTKAKCPKCQVAFVIPHPADDQRPPDEDAAVNGSDSPSERSRPKRGKRNESAARDDADAGSLEDLVDMPRETTPRPVLEAESGFDPLDVLGDSSDGSGTTPQEELRPSVADLMREHQEALEARKSRRSSKKSQAEAPVASQQFTAGTASDALSRSSADR